LNQWVERITEFLPTARIGRIQGSIVSIENKDIIIGMLQSLSMKDYTSSLFETFGFTILDEVHHKSSEVFSNALFKIVTRYMVGLSATMERKDGTTDIFKMFLGGVANHLEITSLLLGGESKLIPDVHPVTVLTVNSLASNLDLYLCDELLTDVVQPTGVYTLS
jgi:superfamily II DNA or RNA helicase